MTTTSIREAHAGDAETLAALAIQVWLHTYATDGITPTIAAYALTEFTAERFAARLARADVTVFVAEIALHLVGYAAVHVDAASAATDVTTTELATLYVQAHFAGRGVGTALLRRAEDFARDRHARPLWLDVWAKNGRALAFYARRGYRVVGTSLFRMGEADHENLVLVGAD